MTFVERQEEWDLFVVVINSRGCFRLRSAHVFGFDTRRRNHSQLDWGTRDDQKLWVMQPKPVIYHGQTPLQNRIAGHWRNYVKTPPQPYIEDKCPPRTEILKKLRKPKGSFSKFEASFGLREKCPRTCLEFEKLPAHTPRISTIALNLRRGLYSSSVSNNSWRRRM